MKDASEAEILKVEAVTKRFGGVKAVDQCSLVAKRGAITGLIGPNGAGKTTLFNIIAGAIRPDEGRIFFDGQDITGSTPHQVFDLGILRTFQIAHEFSNLTCLENLMMVPQHQAGERLLNAVFKPSLVKQSEFQTRKKAEEILAFLNLNAVKYELAGNISGGQKKLLELGRTLMVDAKLVLLDEVAAGVNKSLLKDLASNIERMNAEFGYTFFLIEHDMDFIERLCDTVIVMAQGSVMAEGSMEEIRRNPQIIEAYLGGGAKMKAEGVSA